VREGRPCLYACLMSGERTPDDVVWVESRVQDGRAVYYVVSRLGISALDGAHEDGPYTSRAEAEQVRDAVRASWGSSY